MRILPDFVHPFALLMRLDRPIGVWLLLLPGWWAIVLAAGGVQHLGTRGWAVMALFGLGAIIMRGAGCVINDLWDRNFDQQVERTSMRPLASGQVRVRAGFVFLGALLLCGLCILLQFNLITIFLGILSLPLIVLYPLMKRWTWWPQAFLGITFNFGALMGWAAIDEVVSLSSLLLYAAGILWTLGYDTVYAHQDIEDDMRIGIKSTARYFAAQSKHWVTGFYAASMVFLILALISVPGMAVYKALFLLPAAGHLLWQMRRWDMNSQQSSLAIFKSNRDYGFIVLGGLVLACFI